MVTILRLPSTREQLFGFNAPGHCLVRVRLLHCMRVRLRNGYTRAYAQIMQHTHTHKEVTGRVEAKKLLSRWRQSNYSNMLVDYTSKFLQQARLVSYYAVPLWLLWGSVLLRVLWGYSDATVTEGWEATAHAIAAEYPHSTLSGTVTCISHNGTA